MEPQITPTQRIVRYFKLKNIHQSEVKKFTNVSKQSISNWFTGKVEIRISNIQDILNACPELNPRWVFNGVGPMTRDAKQDDDSKSISVSEERNSDYGQSRKDCLEQLDRANKIIDVLLLEIKELRGENLK